MSWCNAKNQRRYILIEKEIAGALLASEQAELDALQAEMLAYRRRVAPLPLDDLRELHRMCALRALAPAQKESSDG